MMAATPLMTVLTTGSMDQLCDVCSWALQMKLLPHQAMLAGRQGQADAAARHLQERAQAYATALERPEQCGGLQERCDVRHNLACALVLEARLAQAQGMWPLEHQVPELYRLLHACMLLGPLSVLGGVCPVQDAVPAVCLRDAAALWVLQRRAVGAGDDGAAQKQYQAALEQLRHLKALGQLQLAELQQDEDLQGLDLQPLVDAAC